MLNFSATSRRRPVRSWVNGKIKLVSIIIILQAFLLVGWTGNHVNIYSDGTRKEVGLNILVLGENPAGCGDAGADIWQVPLPGSWFWPGIKLAMAGGVPVAAEVAGQSLWSEVPTAGHILIQEGIALGSQDIVESSLGSSGPEQYIKITRVEETIELEQEPVAPPDVRRPDRSLPVGREKVVQEGQPGIKYNKYQVKIVDGVEVERQLLETWIQVQPEPRVVAYGSRAYPAVAARAGETLRFESTAYTHTGNRTATGIWPYRGIVAVDPRVIPLGTRMYVEGYGYAVAQDTGGLIKGNIIDVFMDTEEEAIQWGRRMVNIRIID